MGLRRCPECRHHLTRWGGRLYCANAQCSGSPLSHEHEPNDDDQIPGQLRLPGTDQETAA